MTAEEINQEMERLLDSEPPACIQEHGKFKTWREVFDSEKTSFYIGSTKRKIREEAAQFLIRRTNNIKNNKIYPFTPMITHPDGSRISGIKEAENEFGFQWVPFFENVSMYNCVRLEWALQEKYEHLSKKDCRRLWFKAGCGFEYDNVYGFCMVYISLSFDVLGAIEDGRLIRGRPSLTVELDKRMKQGAYTNS